MRRGLQEAVHLVHLMVAVRPVHLVVAVRPVHPAVAVHPVHPAVAPAGVVVVHQAEPVAVVVPPDN